MLGFAGAIRQNHLKPRKAVFVDPGNCEEGCVGDDTFNSVRGPARIFQALKQLTFTLDAISSGNSEQSNAITNTKFRAIRQR